MKTITTEQKPLDFAVKKWGHKSFAELTLRIAEESNKITKACIELHETRSTYDDLDNNIGNRLLELSQMVYMHMKTLEELQELGALHFLEIKRRAHQTLTKEKKE